jgi:NTP pyrophosphatase (non-canonical NTP hydrolase)
MPHFNKLTPAELERLALLLEELGEAQQAIGKILRHGYDKFNPFSHPSSDPTNRQSLERELGDVEYALELLCAAGDLRAGEIHGARNRKAERIGEYLHHQRKTPRPRRHKAP